VSIKNPKTLYKGLKKGIGWKIGVKLICQEPQGVKNSKSCSVGGAPF